MFRNIINKSQRLGIRTSLRPLCSRWAWIPVVSNEPLAGTAPGSGVPFGFICGCFFGFPAILWAYKCLMMVAFQRRLIYLPSVPPFTRRLTTKDYADQLASLDWRAEALKLPEHRGHLEGLDIGSRNNHEPLAVIVYLQGNAGTPLMRIPVFSRMSRLLQDRVRVVAFAPRGYWYSSPVRVKERTILEDYGDVLTWAKSRYPNAKLILYGHSIGASAAALLSDRAREFSIDGVVLECPMPPIPMMVKGMFPQKWLPYHYLGPLAFDRWDASASLKKQPRTIPMLSFVSDNDELIPIELRTTLFDAWEGSQKRLIHCSALHDTASTSSSWAASLEDFLRSCTAGPK